MLNLSGSSWGAYAELFLFFIYDKIVHKVQYKNKNIERESEDKYATPVTKIQLQYSYQPAAKTLLFDRFHLYPICIHPNHTDPDTLSYQEQTDTLSHSTHS